MEFVRRNQLLKVRVSYDQDDYYFSDFIESEGLERVNDGRNYEYIKIGNPEAMHYTASELKRDERVIEELLLLRHVIGNEFMPALTREEGEVMALAFDAIRPLDYTNIDNNF